ncbi:MAG: FAD-dependent thymidylate synthase [Planctomycetia bacterium]|nr:FAD-dependent thymidylate synthase [Planctomycetia bacterium]
MKSNATAIESLRWEKFQVLDDGFVCLVDCMGDDSDIAQAARVSYGEGTRRVSDDETLIRYLLRHQHSTPFEMAEIKLLVRVPMDCWRQWIRHRTASVNEYSTRYSVAIDQMYSVAPDAWRQQAATNRQGSDGVCDAQTGETLSEKEREIHQRAREIYLERLEAGVARELARKDLPLSTYTEAYWKCDLRNLLHFLALRMEGHAQLEIRQYATIIGEKIVAELFPIAWRAFQDYILESTTLTRLERRVVERLARRGIVPATEEVFLECQDDSWRGLERCRERDECRAKLKNLGLLE